GTYAVGVRDQQYRGGPDVAYRLHLGPVPVVTGVFPLAVRRGAATPVRVSGVNLGTPGGLTVEVSPPADAMIGSKVAVPIPRSAGDPVGPADVVVSDFPAVAVSDTGATLPAVPASADGVLAAPGTAHLVRFPAKTGDRLIVEVEAARLGSPVDSFLEVLDSAGKPLPLAALRGVAKATTNLRDRGSAEPGLRLEAWNELAMQDYLFGDGDLLRIRELPRGPDDDCQFEAVNGNRLGFLATTPKQHAYGTTLFKVEVHPPGTTFPPNGMPTFELFHRNDDGGPGLGKDSRITFDPPADGPYTARVTDATGAGGPRHAYRLTVRSPKPDFRLRVSPMSPAVWAGGAVPLTVTADRLDGFSGPIDVRFDGLPLPFRAPPTTIEAGQLSAAVPLSAGPEPLPKLVSPLKVVGRAVIDGTDVTHDAAGGVPTITEKPDLVTTTASGELVVRPGHEAKFVVKIERKNGFAGRVPLEVRGLPYGVRVLNVGLNGILVLPRDSEREIVVFAEPWVGPTARPFVVSAKREGKPTEFAAPPVVLRVER
ncbi:MAG: c-type cytochrome domain-containing protein, partial [Fimbriiglobus sp.]